MKNIICLIITFTVNLCLSAQIPCNGTNNPSKEVLLYNLKQYPILDTRPSLYIDSCNLSDSIIKQINYRLRNWKWSKESIENYVNSQLSYYKEFYGIDKLAANNPPDLDSIFKVKKDTITNPIKADLVSRMENDDFFKIPPNLVLTVGWLNLQSAKAFLKDTAMKDANHYPIWAVELALARLGEKKIRDRIISEDSKIILSQINDNSNVSFFNSFKRMTYLNTQESIYELHKWVDTAYTIELYASGTELTYLSTEFLYSIKRAILNKEFHEIVRRIPHEGIESTSDILLAKKWLIENKGKYQLNKKLCVF